MHRKSLFYFFGTVFFLNFLLHSPVNGQVQDTSSLDYKFQKARQYAFRGQRKKARAICSELLRREPGYYDAAVLIGRTYGWEHNYEDGRRVLKQVITASPSYRDAIDALIDIEYWDKQYNQSIIYADIGLSFYPGDEDFLYKKARAYVAMGEKEKARDVLNKLLEINPDHKQGNELKKRLFSYVGVEYIFFDYYFDTFEKPYKRRWHMISVGAGVKSGRTPIIGSVNIGQMYSGGEQLYNNLGQQYDLEMYPHITENMYGLVNYAIGIGKIFPKHRAALELFYNLPKGYEISLGARYLRSDEDVFFYTGSISKYYLSYLFSFRSYIFPRSLGMGQTYLLSARKYLGEGDNYVFLEVGTGNSPDEPFVRFDEVKFGNKKVRAGIFRPFKKHYLFKFVVGYENEEYIVDSYRNKFNVLTGIRYYIK